MPSIILMKAFESVPGRYDFGMRLITLGRIDHIRKAIASFAVNGSSVLDIGMGTGALEPMLARNGAVIKGIDTSSDMVHFAFERVVKENLVSQIKVSKHTALEIDRLYPDKNFDMVVMSFVMSELSVEEQRWVIEQAAQKLKPTGILCIADEFYPESRMLRLPFLLIRLPFRLIVYLYTEIRSLNTSSFWWKLYYSIVELPLMLLSFIVSRPATTPLRDIENLLPNNMRIENTQKYLLGTLRMLQIRKEPARA